MPYQRRTPSPGLPTLSTRYAGGPASSYAPFRASGDDELGTLLSAYSATQDPNRMSPLFGLEGDLQSAIQERLTGPAYSPLDPRWQALGEQDRQDDVLRIGQREAAAGRASQEREAAAGRASQERLAGINARGQQSANLLPWLKFQHDIGKDARKLEDERMAGLAVQQLYGAAPPGGQASPSEGPSGIRPPGAPQGGPRDVLGSLDPRIAGKLAGNLPPTLTQPSPEQEARKAAFTTRAGLDQKRTAEAEQAISAQADAATSTLNTIGLIRSELANTSTGTFAWPVDRMVAAAQQLFGIEGDVRARVASGETAQSLITPLLLQALSKEPGKPGSVGGQTSDKDIELLRSIAPSLMNDPAGNEKILTIMERMARVQLARADQLAAWKEGKQPGSYTIDEFEKSWRDEAKKRRLFIDLENPEGFARAQDALRAAIAAKPEAEAAIRDEFNRRFWPKAAEEALGRPGNP